MLAGIMMYDYIFSHIPLYNSDIAADGGKWFLSVRFTANSYYIFLFCVVDLLSGISLKEMCQMADGITFRIGHSNWMGLFDVVDLL